MGALECWEAAVEGLGVGVETVSDLASVGLDSLALGRGGVLRVTEDSRLGNAVSVSVGTGDPAGRGVTEEVTVD